MDRLGACLKGLIMNGADLIKGVDFLNREKNIPRDLIFSGIEKAVRLAISKKYETEEGIEVSINRETGDIKARYGDTVLTPDELGRIAAQSAKQLMIQNFREAESEETFGKYKDRKGDIVYAIVQRVERGLALCNLESDKVEAILPKSEQIPGEMPHTNERLKAIILDVRRTGNRVKIVLSRTHPDFLRRLFEEEIPEIADHVVEIRAVSREAGHRSKIAVSSVDMKVDCVGSCLGTKGSRIKTIIEELGGQERIDVVRWNDSLQVLIDNTLKPAKIDEVFLYEKLGRAIVLVKDDQLSLAIGRKGQNVRLASRLVGWDIEIMTETEFTGSLEKAEAWFSQIPGITDDLVQQFIEAGCLSYSDLECLEPEYIAELAGITEEAADDMLEWAEEAARTVEVEPRGRGSREQHAPVQQAPVDTGDFAVDEGLLGGAPIEEPAPDEAVIDEEHHEAVADFLSAPNEEEAPAEGEKPEGEKAE